MHMKTDVSWFVRVVILDKGVYFMSFKEKVKNMSNKELVNEIREYGCDLYYRELWNVTMNELEIRLGVKAKEIEEAIGYFKHGISHDIFSEDMIKIAEISLEALEKMREDM